MRTDKEEVEEEEENEEQSRKEKKGGRGKNGMVPVASGALQTFPRRNAAFQHSRQTLDP